MACPIVLDHSPAPIIHIVVFVTGRAALDRLANPDPSRRAGVWTAAGVLVLLLVAVAGLAGGPRGPIDGHGLISALPWLYVAAVGVMIVLFFVGLLRLGVPSASLLLQVVAITVALALAPVMLEPYARFPTAYTHVGFMDYIQRTGQILEGYDARFSWPAFFAAAAMFSTASGLDSDTLLRWTPMILHLSYLLALAALVSRFMTDPRRRALTLLLFVLFNWVGQDYFAPQAFAFLLYLVLMAVVAVLMVEPTTRARGFALVAQLLLRDSRPSPIADPFAGSSGVRLGLVAALLVVFSGIVVGHQLTPVFAILSIGVLTVLGFNRSWALCVLLAVLFLAYVFWGAADYWQGHLENMFGGIGDLSSSFRQNFGSRLPAATSTPERAVVIGARVAMVALISGFGLIGLIRNRSRRLVAPAVLTATPLVMLALQSYGGEAVLRAYLFALPFACILAAYAIRLEPPPAGRSSARRTRLAATVGVGAIGCAVLLTFVLARYGNESFEGVQTRDVRTVAELYRLAPPGSTLASLNDHLPWKDRGVGEYEYVQVDSRVWTPSTAEDALTGIAASGEPTYLVVTPSQWSAVRQFEGVAATDITRVQAMLSATPGIRPLYGDSVSGVFLIEPAD